MGRAITTLCVLVLVALAVPAHARNGFWYLGAGVGALDADPSSSRFSATPVVCAPQECRQDIDDGGGSLTIFAGYQASEYLGIEVGAVSLPDNFNIRVTDPNFPPPTTVEVEQDSDAFFVRGVLGLPLSKLSAHPWLAPLSVSAVLGVSHWSSEVTLVVDVTGGGGQRTRVESDSTGNQLVYGARVNYDINANVRLTGAWDRYSDLGRSTSAILRTFPAVVSTVKSDADVYSLNLIYRFR
jgi:hypothetical protein